MNSNGNDQIDPNITVGSVTETVFRLRKGYRNLGIVCLLFFVAIGVASAWGIWSEAPPNRRVHALYAVVFFLCYWGFCAGLSLWVLVGYYRESLEFRDGHVIQQGVIGRKEIYLADVADVHWTVIRSGRITLRTVTEKLRIYLDNFEPIERLWLIRHIENGLPKSVQRDWDLFCYKIAIPLRERDIQANRPPGPDEVTLTRRRLDWYFVPFTILCGVMGFVFSWEFQQPRLLAAPLMPAFLWILLRFTIPRQGLVSKRIGSEPGQTRFLLFYLWWTGIAIVGFLLFALFEPRQPLALALVLVGVVLWFGGIILRAFRFDRERKQRDREAAKVAVQQWNDGERNHDEA